MIIRPIYEIIDLNILIKRPKIVTRTVTENNKQQVGNSQISHVKFLPVYKVLKNTLRKIFTPGTKV